MECNETPGNSTTPFYIHQAMHFNARHGDPEMIAGNSPSSLSLGCVCISRRWMKWTPVNRPRDVEHSLHFLTSVFCWIFNNAASNDLDMEWGRRCGHAQFRISSTRAVFVGGALQRDRTYKNETWGCRGTRTHEICAARKSRREQRVVPTMRSSLNGPRCSFKRKETFRCKGRYCQASIKQSGLMHRARKYGSLHSTWYKITKRATITGINVSLRRA